AECFDHCGVRSFQRRRGDGGPDGFCGAWSVWHIVYYRAYGAVYGGGAGYASGGGGGGAGHARVPGGGPSTCRNQDRDVGDGGERGRGGGVSERAAQRRRRRSRGARSGNSLEFRRRIAGAGGGAITA